MNAPIYISKEQKIARYFIRVNTTVFGLLWLPAIAMAIAMLSSFQDLSVLQNRGYWFMAISAISMPIVIGIGIIGSRSMFREEEYKIAIFFCFLPVANVFFYLFGWIISRQ